MFGKLKAAKQVLLPPKRDESFQPSREAKALVEIFKYMLNDDLDAACETLEAYSRAAQPDTGRPKPSNVDERGGAN